MMCKPMRCSRYGCQRVGMRTEPCTAPPTARCRTAGRPWVLNAQCLPLQPTTASSQPCAQARANCTRTHSGSAYSRYIIVLRGSTHSQLNQRQPMLVASRARLQHDCGRRFSMFTFKT